MIPSAITRRFQRLVGERPSSIESMWDLGQTLHRQQPVPIPARGWRRLYAENVLQAHLGADLEPLSPGV